MCVARACEFGESNIVCIVMVRSIAWNKEYHLTSSGNIFWRKCYFKRVCFECCVTILKLHND